MGLINGGLQIGQSALLASQAALQIIGNNIANASNPDFSRQRPDMTPAMGGALLPGVQSGMGVQLSGVQRIADEAVNASLRSATSDSSGARTASDMLNQIETVFNALGDTNLSTQLSAFLNSFTDLANDPTSSASRTMVLQAADSLTRAFGGTSDQLTALRTQINGQLSAMTSQANQLIAQVADLNGQITQVEFGLVGTNAGSLRDQRDTVLRQLAQLVDLQTQTGENGIVNVFAGSTPLVMNGDTFLFKAGVDASSGYPDTVLKMADTGQPANITGGQIGGLLTARDQGLTQVTDDLDNLAGTLIDEVNKIHASGQGLTGLTDATSANAVTNDGAALDAAGLRLTPQTGTFQIHVTNAAGLSTAQTIAIDLTGTGSDTTLNALAADISAQGNVTATAQADGTLRITAASGYTFTFSDDTSNVLAALGLNTFFTGKGASTIAVRDGLTASQIAAATNGSAGDNSNALRLAALANAPLKALQGATLDQGYQNLVTSLASSSAEASAQYQTADAMTTALTNRRDAISGVSVDEETIELMKYQRAFQGASHYLSLINQLMDEILKLV